jgi:ubiquinone/menaquinone biosynthesis C-methylase UbiE
MSAGYVHGYSKSESTRLEDQANCLNGLLHHDTTFPDGSTVLEAGCGIGAQTVIVAPKNPGARFVSIDISEDSLRKAEALARSRCIRNVEFHVGDILDLKFPDGHFDHIFVCFVLEHLPDPVAALRSLKRVLKRGGTITLIEGDHGSAYFYPESRHAQEAINALVELQSRGGGNALIGRQLYPLMVQSGFKNCSVSPRMVYVDSSKPNLVEGFIKNTFTAMIEGIREKAVSSSVAGKDAMESGIQGLYRTCGPDGVFCYTFFKGIGHNI